MVNTGSQQGCGGGGGSPVLTHSSVSLGRLSKVSGSGFCLHKWRSPGYVTWDVEKSLGIVPGPGQCPLVPRGLFPCWALDSSDSLLSLAAASSCKASQISPHLHRTLTALLMALTTLVCHLPLSWGFRVLRKGTGRGQVPWRNLTRICWANTGLCDCGGSPVVPPPCPTNLQFFSEDSTARGCRPLESWYRSPRLDLFVLSWMDQSRPENRSRPPMLQQRRLTDLSHTTGIVGDGCPTVGFSEPGWTAASSSLHHAKQSVPITRTTVPPTVMQ